VWETEQPLKWYKKSLAMDFGCGSTSDQVTNSILD
jgi:hypothetical protein